MTLSPGDRFDRYVVEGLLGRGGMGEVWQAIDPKLDRRIALKILASADPLDPRWAEASNRMMREARAVAALNHPNVVAVFDVGKVGDTPYIAMELVEGATLRAYVGDPRISPRRRAQWMIEIARALASAHRRGIVHRDVKPENVMVRGDGTLKVLDFGIARRVRVESSQVSERASSSVTRDGELVGTLLYMAPEQLWGTVVDARADQFAWGIVALELIRGEHPWGAKSTTPHLLNAILYDEPPALEAGPDLAEDMATAIARAIAKRPEDRFPSMDALLETIEGAEPLPSVRMAPIAPIPFVSTVRPVTIDDRPPPSLPFEPGAVLAERYQIVRLLGRGGMGDVYEAIDRENEQHVALKMVRADQSNDARAAERFQREIALTRRVVHPNVARVLDVRTFASISGQRPGVLLAMELLDGETLADRIRRRGRLEIDEALPIAREMASALGAAHAAGVVHRDLKSANVFLVPRADGGVRTVVTDFGLARAIDRADEHGENLSHGVVLLGTAAYMAPEQIGGQPVDARADVYALGVVLFEMVTGRLPFVARSEIETAMMRLTQAPPSPRTLLPPLDERWEHAILRCMAREPRDRFQSVAEAVSALDGEEAPVRSAASFEAPLPLASASTVRARVEVPPEAPAERPRRTSSRRAWIGAGALLATGALVMVTASRHPSSPAAAPSAPPAASASPLILPAASLSPVASARAVVAQAAPAASSATPPAISPPATASSRAAAPRPKKGATAPAQSAAHRESGENGAPIIDPD